MNMSGNDTPAAPEPDHEPGHDPERDAVDGPISWSAQDRGQLPADPVSSAPVASGWVASGPRYYGYEAYGPSVPPAGPLEGLAADRRDARRRKARRRRVASGVVVATLLVGAAIGLVTNPGGSGSTTRTTAAAVAQVDGPPLSVAEITSALQPATVDITSTLNQGAAAGTGMILTSKGEILTNNHVIAGATAISVKLSADDSKTYVAHLVGADVTDDVAVLQLDNASGLSTVKLGSSAQLTVGQQVVAIGNALNLPGPPRVTEGSIQGLGRSITASDGGSGGTGEQLNNLIQIDAELAPGNSGGPLVDLYGRVVGMNTAAESSFRSQSSTVGFAIPIDDALAIVHQIENGVSSGNVRVGAPPLLGVQIQDQSNSRFGGGTAGALVVGVQAGTPAASAGLVTGDTITGLGGTSVTSAASLSQAMQSHRPGDKVEVVWVDGSGSRHSATVTLASGAIA